MKSQKTQAEPTNFNYRNLNIPPLALAKYFYGQKVKDIAAIQRLIYLVFLKILQEKNGGPVVESAFQPMSESQDYANLFTNVPEIENKEVLLYLKEIYHTRRNLVDEFDYQKIELGDILKAVKASPHFCLIEDGYDKVKIGEYLRLSKKQITNLKNEDNIYQIPLGEEEKFRAIGILRTSGEKYLFELLFLDPNHLFYPNLAKKNLPHWEEFFKFDFKQNYYDYLQAWEQDYGKMFAYLEKQRNEMGEGLMSSSSTHRLTLIHSSKIIYQQVQEIKELKATKEEAKRFYNYLFELYEKATPENIVTLTEEAKQEVKKLEEEDSESEETTDYLYQKIDKIMAFAKEKNIITQKLELAEQKITDLEQQLTQIRSQQLYQQIIALRTEKGKLKEELNHLWEQLKNNQDNPELVRQISEKETQSNQLKEQLKKAKKEQDEKDAKKLAKKDKEIKELKEKIAEIAGQLKILEQKMKQTQEELTANKKQFEELQKKFHTLQQSNNNLNQSNRDLIVIQEELKKQIDQLTTDKSDNYQKWQDCLNTIQQLEKNNEEQDNLIKT
ncbi:11242_t:CDS:2, partial [Racocetra fulgida]